MDGGHSWISTAINRWRALYSGGKKGNGNASKITIVIRTGCTGTKVGCRDIFTSIFAPGARNRNHRTYLRALGQSILEVGESNQARKRKKKHGVNVAIQRTSERATNIYTQAELRKRAAIVKAATSCIAGVLEEGYRETIVGFIFFRICKV